ncbi:MAG: LysR family transcriptional regulator [Oscillospiraceae bacterium]|nr:LysR family transcriptional regulator [Oscillospiraceae bacterium]
MISRYGIFCKVAELGSFTRAAESCGYSQSAISQNIKALEQETGVSLLSRRKDGVQLTADGRDFFPYLQAVWQAEQALERRRQETMGLKNSVIRIGTFTSVSRNLLPPKMKAFKARYPDVRFVLRQGEYTSIPQWIRQGEIDFGFVNQDAVDSMDTRLLYEDHMLAVLPQGHPLEQKPVIPLKELSREPLILLDEGDHSVLLDAFRQAGQTPNIAYEVYDDYSILSMVRQGLGISVLYEKVVSGFESGLSLRPILEAPRRRVALAWSSWETMPYAARRFAEFLMGND